jgi:hypothetical protein
VRETNSIIETNRTVLMPDTTAFIKNEFTKFIRTSRDKKNLDDKIRIEGYSLDELEERAYRLPTNKLFQVLQLLSTPDEALEWLMELQILVIQRRIKR